VVLCEDEPFLIFVVQPPSHFSGQLQFLVEPHRHSLEKRLVSLGRIGNIGFKQAVKFQVGFIIEADVVELTRFDSRLFQAVLDSLSRKLLIIFLTTEAFFLSRGTILFGTSPTT